MSHPRFIYYNDAHHFHAKRLEPPASLHMLQWPVDEVAGTSVDTLVLGLGYSDVYFHRSKVGRVVGQRKDSWDSWIDWRIVRMAEAAEQLDTDQLEVCIDRGRHLGIRVIPSLKLQDVSPPGDERCGWLKWEQKQAVCIGEEGRYLYAYDWMHDAVAAAKLDLVREVIDDYGADGIELDFMFDLRYFGQGQADAGASVMTAFVRNVHDIAAAAAAQRGTPVSVSVRISADNERNLAAGLRVEQWLQAGLLDWVVAEDSGLLVDSEPKPSWLPAATTRHGAAAYYRPPRRVYHEATITPHIEMYRGLLQTLREGGWQGLYHGYLLWPFGAAEHDFLREVGFPETTARRNKRYYLQPREGAPGEPTSTPQRLLPVQLQEATPVSLAVHVADDVDAARADGELRHPVLTLQFQSFCNEDTLRVHFNGRELSLRDAEITDERALFYPAPGPPGPLHAPAGGAFHWFRFRLDVDEVTSGANSIQVELVQIESRATFPRNLNAVDLRLRYRDMQRPRGLGEDALAPRG